MARVSLVLPIAPSVAAAEDRVVPFQRVLEEAGHQVETIVVSDPRVRPEPLGLGDSTRTLIAERPGMAAATLHGLRAATGDLLVVLELDRGYTPRGLLSVVEPVARGEAELAVASRHGERGFWGGPSAWSGTMARGFLGTSDPSSGLVALTRKAVPSTDRDRSPVGSRFALELLARAGGRRVDVPIRPRPTLGWARLELDDLRHIKRLADHRFGNASRLFQFCVVGASGMVVDLGSYALFQLIFSRTFLATLPAPWSGGSCDLAVAGALAIAIAVVWNFSLNRRLTFNDARQGSIARQFAAYVLGNALAIALSYTVRMVLPVRVAFFGRHRLAAALVGIIAATGISFSMSRWVVFNRRVAGNAQSPRHASEPPRTEASSVY